MAADMSADTSADVPGGIIQTLLLTINFFDDFFILTKAEKWEIKKNDIEYLIG